MRPNHGERLADEISLADKQTRLDHGFPAQGYECVFVYAQSRALWKYGGDPVHQAVTNCTHATDGTHCN